MSKNWRVGVCGASAFAGMVWLATAVFAGDFAAVDTKGVLTLEVRVEGAGRVNSQGAGWDNYDWQVHNKASLRVELEAMESAVDAQAFAGMGNPGADDDGDDWEAAWDGKIDACNGDENCERMVNMQKMQDPHMQARMGKAMAMMKNINMNDLAPSVQQWTALSGTVTGTASVEEQVDTHGIIEPGGGPKTDSHCRTAGKATLKPRPTGYGDRQPLLTVNAKDSTYELILPAQVAVTVADDCNGGRTKQVALFHVADTLSATGKLSGSSDQPSLSGTKEWQGRWGGGDGHPIRVIVDWSFSP